MTIDRCNGVHEAMLELIPELEAGRSPEIGDIGRLDHPGDCGPHVMPRFRGLAARVASLPRSHPFTGCGTFLYSIFGRLDSRGAYALLAFHLRRHIPHISIMPSGIGARDAPPDHSAIALGAPPAARFTAFGLGDASAQRGLHPMAEASRSEIRPDWLWAYGW